MQVDSTVWDFKTACDHFKSGALDIDAFCDAVTELSESSRQKEQPKPKPLLVYVAGAYSADTVLGVFGNMRRGLAAAKLVLDAGHYPFVPWCDFLVHMQMKLTIEQCYAWSLAFMERCDCVYVVKEGSAKSRGTQAEIKRASQIGIPVFFTMAELKQFGRQNRQ